MDPNPNETPPAAPAQPLIPQRNGKRTGALSRLMNRATTDESGRGGRLRRRRICFTIDPEICEPGAFEADFELVMEAPSAEQELAAAKLYGAQPGAMVLELIKSCLVSIDGEPLRDSDMSREVVWEALGMTGRALIGEKFASIQSVTPEARKKADTSTKLIVG